MIEKVFGIQKSCFAEDCGYIWLKFFSVQERDGKFADYCNMRLKSKMKGAKGLVM